MLHDVFITVCIFPIKENKISFQNEIYYSNKYIVQDQQVCMLIDQLGQVEMNRL